MSLRRRLMAAATLAFAAGMLNPGVALAGERAGTGEPVTINAKSDCAYSGLEDFDFEAPAQPGVTQNWGQIPKDFREYLTSIGVSPATLCNAHLNPIK